MNTRFEARIEGNKLIINTKQNLRNGDYNCIHFYDDTQVKNEKILSKINQINNIFNSDFKFPKTRDTTGLNKFLKSLHKIYKSSCNEEFKFLLEYILNEQY